MTMLLLTLTLACLMTWTTVNSALVGRNSDPHNDIHAIEAISHTFAGSNIQLPIGNSPSLEEDIPGDPLSPDELKYEPPEKDWVPQDSVVDPTLFAEAFQGDIVLRNVQELQRMTADTKETISTRNAVNEEQRTWTDRKIPYVLSSSFNREQRGKIAVAMRNFKEATCLEFVPRKRQTDYLHLHKGTGCSSIVGRLGGNQEVSLVDGCMYVGIIMHELMHAVGFWHEQSRFDRDNYIKIYFNQIQSGMEYNFKKYDWNTISNLSAPYDLRSIMHYGPKSFSKNGRNTIESYDGTPIGQRNGFSEIDKMKLNSLYKCDQTGGSGGGGGGGFGGGGGSSISSLSCNDDWDSNKCAAWARMGECTKNPSFMMASCRKSCNNCRKCEDTNSHCEYWAKMGECTKNFAYMESACKKSCRLCHTQCTFMCWCIRRHVPHTPRRDGLLLQGVLQALPLNSALGRGFGVCHPHYFCHQQGHTLPPLPPVGPPSLLLPPAVPHTATHATRGATFAPHCHQQCHICHTLLLVPPVVPHTATSAISIATHYR
ncbi:Peptidase M12A [Trinorchestia longiramus]|nr:Peptidase M12A [Trinorchestia longiramus]